MRLEKSINMTSEHPFLRAINLQYDADVPERIAHYEPTAKAVSFLRGVSGQTPDRSFFVIAPYGSGKSLGAAYLLHLLENRRQSLRVLEAIQKRLKRVSPELGQFAEDRLRDDSQHGVVIALEGACDDIGESMARAAAASLRRINLTKVAEDIESTPVEGIRGAVALLDRLVDMGGIPDTEKSIDRVAIVWDEFGRHVEQLVRAGRPDRLSEIQHLAEYAVRQQKLPVTFGPIMHQGLLQYASGLSQSALSEWRKIEGRFEPIRYVDDSREVYWLIGKLVSSNRSSRDLFGGDHTKAERAKSLGLFDDFGAELSELLNISDPLDPATLYVLPQLAARVAQHERTLFGFLLSSDLSAPVTADYLYDYFSGAMQADTSLGGTYRKWLETESALAKAENNSEVKTLKVASVLELGLSGSRQRLTRELLEYALGGAELASKTVDSLLNRKLLLHRQRTDQISVWHGTDIDLRARLDEEIARQGAEFDLIEQLNTHYCPAAFRPVRHNDDFGIRRFFSGTFISVGEFKKRIDSTDSLLNPGEDGQIIYLVPRDETERTMAVDVARSCSLRRLVIVVPLFVGDLYSAAAEVRALERLAENESLLSEDPLVEKELQQMIDEAQAHMHAQVASLTQPGDTTVWYHGGELLEVYDVATVLSHLSDICDAEFYGTPKINNEMIVRHRLSPPLVNARKKTVMGILERHGQERVGIQGENADASVFRTVLDRTGLYRRVDDGSGFRYAEPEELNDPNLRAVWTQFKDLITKPTEEPKNLEKFFRDLTEPPIGMRRGVIPIFFSAALRAFQSTLAITDYKGEYLEDLVPSVIEDICANPERYTLQVFEFNDSAKAYLESLTCIFSSSEATTNGNSSDLMREAYDAFEGWRTRLPPGARDTRSVGERGRGLQSAVRATLSPFELFFKKFPQLAKSNDFSTVETWVSGAKAELEAVLSQYRLQAISSLDDCLHLGPEAPSASMRERFKYWRETLPDGVGERLGGMPRNVLNLNLEFYKTDEALIDAAAALVVGLQPKRWNDADLQRFRNEISSLVSRIESAALSNLNDYDDIAVQLVERRLKTYMGHLVEAIGPNTANQRVQKILDDLGA